MKSPSATVRMFIESINAHDVDRLCGLMSDRHQFIDASGKATEGRAVLRNGWKQYLEWFPDYRIEADFFMEDGSTVLVIGFAAGSWKGSSDPNVRWRLPAAWRAVVQDGVVKEWQVFCDTKIVFDIIQRNSL